MLFTFFDPKGQLEFHQNILYLWNVLFDNNTSKGNGLSIGAIFHFFYLNSVTLYVWSSNSNLDENDLEIGYGKILNLTCQLFQMKNKIELLEMVCNTLCMDGRWPQTYKA